MLSLPGAVPKVVSVRVQKAERLRIIPKADGKQRKYTQKWKVVFLGGKKKMSSGSILAPAGNPVWDYEVTFKVASRGEPISLLVTDSEDHHVGQVVIPVSAMPPRPANSSERPTDPSRLRVADLEPTKKVENPIGTLYYWVWVEEYRNDEDDKKSTRGSMLSLSSHKHSKKAASVADSLNYRGSVLSVASTDMEGKVKKSKNPFKKKHHTKDLLKSAVDVSQKPSLGLKTMNTTPVFPRARSVFDPTAVTDDHDGSVLGAYSDLTGSDLYRSGSHTRLEQKSSGFPSFDEGPEHSTMSPSSRASVRIERPGSAQPDDSSMFKSVGNKPSLTSIEPNSCPTEGGVEVTIKCSHMTEEIVRYATLLIDGYSVNRQDWFHQECKPGAPNQSEIRVYMPSRPPGRCYIELETMKHGRIRCGQEFTFTETKPAAAIDSAAGDNRPTLSMPKSNLSTNSGSELGNSSPFRRTSSQRSSLLVRDGRSIRRKQMAADLQKSTPPVESNSSTAQRPNQILPDRPNSRIAGMHDPTTKEDHSPVATSFLDSGLGQTGSEQSDYVSPKSFIPSGIQPLSEKELPPEPPESSSDEEYMGRPEKPTDSHRRSSLRSAASGQSRSALDDNYRLENEGQDHSKCLVEMKGLRAMLNDANSLIDSMRKHTVELEQLLSSRNAEVDRLSMELCKLRNRLLQDGCTKYLEMKT